MSHAFDRAHGRSRGTARQDRRSAAAAAIGRAVAASVESLERRALLSADVQLSVVGDATALEGTPYTLHLSATGADAANINHWNIDWGDGTTTTAAGAAASPTHSYAVEAAGVPIGVQAVLNDNSVVAAGLPGPATAGVPAFAPEPTTWYTTTAVPHAGGYLSAGAVMDPDNDGPTDGADTLLARYNADGTLDTSFGSSGFVADLFGGEQDVAADVGVNPVTGDIVIVGFTASASTGHTSLTMQRFDGADGTPLGATFASDFGYGFAGAGGVAFDAAGRIYVTGSVSADGQYTDVVVARFTAAGALDATFGTDGVAVEDVATFDGSTRTSGTLDYGADLLVLPNGGGVAVAVSTDLPGSQGGEYGYALLVLDADGQSPAQPTAWGTTELYARAIERDPTSGALLIGGHTLIETTEYGNMAAPAVARFNATTGGTFVAATTFGDGNGVDGDGVAVAAVGLAGELSDLATDADGNVVIAAGVQNDPADLSDKAFAAIRLTPTGQLDATFGDDGVAYADVGYQADARLVVVDGDTVRLAGGAMGAFDSQTGLRSDNGFGVVAFTAAPPASALSVDVVNAPPVAGAGADVTAAEGATVTRTGTATDPGAADVLTGAWQVRNAAGGLVATASGLALSFTPDLPGTYTATLTVTDDGALVATDAAVITITDVLPAANAGADLAGATAVLRGLDAASFAGTASAAAAGDAIVGYEWDLDYTGTFDVDATGVAASRTYAAAGTYTVALRVTDDDGQQSVDTATVSVVAAKLVNGDLVVAGTGGADDAYVKHVGGGGTVSVLFGGGAGGASVGTFAVASDKRIYVHGGDGNDLIQVEAAVARPATLNGGDGNDTLRGGGGNDALSGGAGNDLFRDSPGADDFTGGGGADEMTYADKSTAVWVSLDGVANDGAAAQNEGDNVRPDIETLRGTAYADILDAGMSSLPFTLIGGATGDALKGGSGNDVLHGEDGNDTLTGGAGNDVFYDSPGADDYTGGSGADQMTYADKSTAVWVSLDGVANDGAAGQNEGDNVRPDVETIRGTAYADILDAGMSSFSFTLIGGPTGDDLKGGGGADTILGEDGNDTLRGGGGNDSLNGGAGNDLLLDSGGADDYAGGPGYDEMSFVDKSTAVWVSMDGVANDGAAGENEGDNVRTDIEAVRGTQYADILDAGMSSISFTLIGAGSSDVLRGGAGNDALYGEDGNDTLTGNGGADALYGGNGDDYLDARDNQADVIIDGGAHSASGVRDRGRYDLILDLLYQTGIETIVVL